MTESAHASPRLLGHSVAPGGIWYRPASRWEHLQLLVLCYGACSRVVRDLLPDEYDESRPL